ncbi:FtsX-like permease family protein [Streptomyces gamaensis]|uniref:FtsX-like permease family protein n=1 Tax=Streptomyces gamaensis TaxID=1763542 RepID=A0ABW0YTT0_9ACTN
MGWASARRTPGGSIRAVALLLSAAFLALGLSSAVAVYAAYDGISARSSARALQYKDASPGSRTIARGIDSFDEVDGLQYSVVYLRPVSDEVSRPPGIKSWPKPGEAFLSPGLQRALAAEGAQDRFGKVVGTISDEGLASPGEKYAYVNPTDRQYNAKDAHELVGFGGSGSGASGDMLFIENRGRLLTALLLILLPAVALVVVAVRMGSDGRDRRTALLSALGGGHQYRTWLNLGESALPVVVGALLGTVPAIVVMAVHDVRLPWINYWLSSADIRRYAWETALSGSGAAFIILLLVCVLHRQGRRGSKRSSRLAARTSQITRWAAMACPVLIFATVWGPQQLDPAEYSDLRMKFYNIGVVLVLATLPGAVAYGASVLGTRLAGSARRTGSGGPLVAGRSYGCPSRCDLPLGCGSGDRPGPGQSGTAETDPVRYQRPGCSGDGSPCGEEPAADAAQLGKGLARRRGRSTGSASN